VLNAPTKMTFFPFESIPEQNANLKAPKLKYLTVIFADNVLINKLGPYRAINLSRNSIHNDFILEYWLLKNNIIFNCTGWFSVTVGVTVDPDDVADNVEGDVVGGDGGLEEFSNAIILAQKDLNHGSKVFSSGHEYNPHANNPTAPITPAIVMPIKKNMANANKHRITIPKGYKTYNKIVSMSTQMQ